MTQTGDDRELVLGNKQLISLFFVVVALCGVFFAMGYMIGRNSGKASLAADAGAAPGSTALPSAFPPRQQPEPPRETPAATPDASLSPAADTPATPPLETRPAQDIPAREIATQEPPVRDTPAAPATRPQSALADTRGVSVPEAGASYLQVTALPRADADNVVRTLREQSFPTILASSSRDGLFRVLVGPYHHTTQLADAKSRLKSMGFGSAFVQKQ